MSDTQCVYNAFSSCIHPLKIPGTTNPHPCGMVGALVIVFGIFSIKLNIDLIVFSW